MGDAVTGINRADSASEKSNGPMLRQHHAVCNSSRCPGSFLLPDWQVVWASGLSARLTVAEPDGLPTAARVLRMRRRSRGRG
jgi:hypothetical protein